MWLDYITERTDKKVKKIEDVAFCVYFPQGEYLYIEDIFVSKSHRRSGIGSKLADMVAEEAKADGYTKLLGSVDPRTKGATESMMSLFAYGFKLFAVENGLVYLTKEI